MSDYGAKGVGDKGSSELHAQMTIAVDSVIANQLTSHLNNQAPY